ncbi:DUF2285 domain-containing protein [Solimonas terrae]|uniref:DUF2285 domain-containing protein n=1 Tax=Solimonas terrae TaxID=1396819 RepID=A0A6M2BU94_9GAMM|nr:DUF2285 domain-containing protein [Solimonas terrae]NGY05944.1 DUF2285 domain-containing protein [Solimonas terrae]
MRAPAIGWHPVAAYLYVFHLDGPALAWEYLRRHPGYRCDWQRYRRRPHERHALRWGLRLLEDPGRDARDAQPDWTPDPDRLVLVRPDDDPPHAAPPFRLWSIPGRKRLLHDGRRLVLSCQLVDRTLRLALSPMLADGMAYAYAVRAGSRLNERLRTTGPELAVLDATAAGRRTAIASNRPGRASLLHLLTMQALDGTQAGASQRELAEVLFGQEAVAERWHGDSELRAHVRRLVRRGQRFMQGGYRQLLCGGR